MRPLLARAALSGKPLGGQHAPDLLEALEGPQGVGEEEEVDGAAPDGNDEIGTQARPQLGRHRTEISRRGRHGGSREPPGGHRGRRKKRRRDQNSLLAAERARLASGSATEGVTAGTPPLCTVSTAKGRLAGRLRRVVRVAERLEVLVGVWMRYATLEQQFATHDVVHVGGGPAAAHATLDPRAPRMPPEIALGDPRPAGVVTAFARCTSDPITLPSVLRACAT